MRHFFLIIALALAVLGAYDAGLALSAAFGFAAVVAPQTIAFAAAQKGREVRVFGVWALKFSLTFLLLAVSARFLQAVGLLTGLPFVAGVTIGVLTNIVFAYRFSRRLSEARV